MPTSGGSQPAFLPSESGHIAADVTLTHAATVTVITTASLAVGVWLVSAKVLGECAAVATAGIDVELTAGTATATLEGSLSGTFPDIGHVLTAAEVSEVTVTAIVTVTVAGTLTVKAHNSDAVNDGVAYHLSQGGSAFIAATGYTAIKIA